MEYKGSKFTEFRITHRNYHQGIFQDSSHSQASISNVDIKYSFIARILEKTVCMVKSWVEFCEILLIRLQEDPHFLNNTV